MGAKPFRISLGSRRVCRQGQPMGQGGEGLSARPRNAAPHSNTFVLVIVGMAQAPRLARTLARFRVKRQFASWLGLCPTNEQSGCKILNRRTRKVANRATVAFRNAALTLLRSQSYLGTQYRRLRTRLALPKPSLPWLESWPAGSTGSSNTASLR